MTAVAERTPGRAASTRALLTATRPKQWVKNLLVLAAPAAAGVLFKPSVAVHVVLTLVAMTLTSAACYLTNDVLDRHVDRLHVVKSRRPIASGAVSVQRALATAAVLGGLGLALAAAIAVQVLAVAATYATLTLLYAVRLKHVPWLELAVVASGFVLRALAGAAAASVDASEWFLVVVTSAALIIVAGKRTSELVSEGVRARPVLLSYRRGQLRAVTLGATGALVCSYAGWAAFRPDPLASRLALASLVPVLLVLGRWARETARGLTGAPEDVLLLDPWVRAGVLAWGCLFVSTVLVALPG
ncbi:MAG: decaprenyl-phosphate phosphoribosyltransferase [Frankiales bacterium]|jgi:decaprenyl-phosphate phosphoribosyltransferase|nr:decaprenyl-phosphate phosphoribosyltransferase [Frankiales bacterium]